jgi:hypothetical protein
MSSPTSSLGFSPSSGSTSSASSDEGTATRFPSIAKIKDQANQALNPESLASLTFAKINQPQQVPSPPHHQIGRSRSESDAIGLTIPIVQRVAKAKELPEFGLASSAPKPSLFPSIQNQRSQMSLVEWQLDIRNKIARRRIQGSHTRTVSVPALEIQQTATPTRWAVRFAKVESKSF